VIPKLLVVVVQLDGTSLHGLWQLRLLRVISSTALLLLLEVQPGHRPSAQGKLMIC
jgi:hypothetical protein